MAKGVCLVWPSFTRGLWERSSSVMKKHTRVGGEPVPWGQWAAVAIVASGIRLLATTVGRPVGT